MVFYPFSITGIAYQQNEVFVKPPRPVIEQDAMNIA
jgi:hypothetical protein